MKEMLAIGLNEAINSLLEDTTEDDKDLYRPLTEMESFLALDPVLANLSKQLDEAKAQYEALVQQLGAGDDMTKMILETIESTQSAIDTRIIELREETESGAGQMSAKIHALNEGIKAEEERAQEERFKKEQAGFKAQRERMEKVANTDKYNAMHLLAMAVWHIMFNENMDAITNTRKKYSGLFNKMKNRDKFGAAFANASHMSYAVS